MFKSCGFQHCLRNQLVSNQAAAMGTLPHRRAQAPTLAVSHRTRRSASKRWAASCLTWTAGESTGPWPSPEPLVRRRGAGEKVAQGQACRPLKAHGLTQGLGMAVSCAEKAPVVCGIVLSIRLWRHSGECRECRHRHFRNLHLTQKIAIQDMSIISSLKQRKI